MRNDQSGIKHFLSHVTKIWYFKKNLQTGD